MEIRPAIPEDSSLETRKRVPGSPVARPPVSWWWLASVLAVGLILGIGGLELFRYLARPLALLVLAISISAALTPVVDWLDRYIPYGLAVAFVYLTLVLLAFGILASTIPLLVAQVRSLIHSFGSWQPQISQWLDQYGFDTSNLNNALLSEAGRLGDLALRLPLGLGSALVEFVLVLFLSLYWLLLTPRIKGYYLSFFPLASRPLANGVIGHIGTAMGGYLRGSAINGLIIGVLQYLGLLVIGVPYALTLGALAGLLEFFPTIGPVIAGAMAGLVALSVSPRTALITIIFAVVLQQLEGHILVPLIMRRQAEISPVLAIFAVISGAAIGGLLGAIVAIPTVSAVRVLFHMVIAPAVRRANGVEAEEV